ncbi:MAG: bifunctional 4-hydroxy-2-oxoglutarate aldolase/2-dehydro-3-deoxy-phosphogluconate aldolase, partial [Clostridia bacterium]|nr:bifunctional 4-hydroxy-2-oxoglutarate aldolase/2-dehydro-3-deoxy-phosphogluconate aldolase [Clostridia bacterium]
AEITFRTAAAPEAIRLVKENLPEVMLGAGTVLTVEQAKQAVDSGARYILSPGFNPTVVAWCVENDIPVIPGCSCPSDIEAALEFGLKLVKIFPAESLGGVKFLKALSGPYVNMSFAPTGGLNENNMLDYLALPKVKCVGGSWMVPSDAVKNKDWDKITETTQHAVKLMLGLELKHVGINNENAEEAMKGAMLMSKLTGLPIKDGNSAAFVGADYEFCKVKKPGKNGHIAISTNCISRAVWHLEQQGFVFGEPQYNSEGKFTSIYLKDEICGFGVHLLQK